jgi:hypothetical protein
MLLNWRVEMIFEKEPTLKEFSDKFTEYTNDLMTADGNVTSHTFPAVIYVEVEGSEHMYPIKELEIGFMGGCGCPQSLTIIVREENNDNT